MGIAPEQTPFLEVSPQMTQCNSQLHFGFLSGKAVVGGFDGGDISSDGGLLLIAEVDRALGLTAQMAAVLDDSRQAGKIHHSVHDLLRQRIYQIAAGYEDCNDADRLRHDPVLKVAAERLPETGADLASQPTLSRFENSVSRRQLYALAHVFLDLFVVRHAAAPPPRIILDRDATDDETPGQQELAGFHGYYDEHCYLPLIVTAEVDDGSQELLAFVLRPGRSPASRGAVAVLRRIRKRLRQALPDTELLLRGDSGFGLPEVYDWCEAQEQPVDYVLGLAQNSRLHALAQPYMEDAETVYEETGEPVRRFHEFEYAAKSWPHPRRVILKAEVTAEGPNPRFVVTNMAGEPEELYDLYGRRGESENRIKELKNDLQIDRTSCHRFLANQLRVLLHAAAFILVSALRGTLAGTEWARAQVCTLQRSLLKLGVRVKESVRRVLLQFASSCPLQELWPLVLARLRAGPRPAWG
jgi:hypothetical protein